MLLGEDENLSTQIQNILTDYSSQLFTSIIAINELIQLVRIGKIKSKKYKKTIEFINTIEFDLKIKIVAFTNKNLETLANLTIADGHNDPFDHAIISQAISDKITLISSDTKFKHYVSQKLKFVFNRR
jgi:tRNA(fMet)-specific endonuclease VapC